MGIIFDGDDTLWETTPTYARAKREFCHVMALLGFDSTEVLNTLESVDIANVDRMGFSKDRFPNSMSTTYRLFCERRSLPPDAAIGRKIEEIGYSVFAGDLTPCKCVEQVLERLQLRYKLILATKGDHMIQHAKVERSGLARFFKSVYVLERKTEHEFRRIAEECELDVSNSWVIGDSLKSDINPGLRAGFKAIWIPSDAWAYEQDELRESDRLYEVNNLQDSLKILAPETV